jgi:hypothetical protein
MSGDRSALSSTNRPRRAADVKAATRRKRWPTASLDIRHRDEFSGQDEGMTSKYHLTRCLASRSPRHNFDLVAFLSRVVWARAGAQSLCEGGGVSGAPKVHVRQPRRLIGQVVVQRDDRDAMCCRAWITGVI